MWRFPLRTAAARRTVLLPALAAGFVVLAAGSPGMEDPDRQWVPWASLASLPEDLARVREAALGPRPERRAALRKLVADEGLSKRARGVAAFRLGTIELDRGRWTAGLEALDHPAVGASALAPEALLRAGRELPAARTRQAIQRLEQLLVDHPDGLDADPARLELARRLGDSRRHDEALRMLGLVERPGLRADVLAARARSLEALGRGEEAARALEILYYDMPAHVQSLPAGRKLSKLYRTPGVRSPAAASRYPGAMRRAAGFARAGDHRRAHQNYLEVANRFARAADTELVRLRIGVSEFHRGRLSASLRTLMRVRRDDLLPEALFYRGEALRRLERVTRQTEVLEELLALPGDHPFRARALYSMARSRIARHDREGALPYLARLATLPPGAYRRLFATWHVLWDRYRNGDHDGLAEALETVARENSGEFMAGQFLYFAGRVHETSGNRDAAAGLYREVFLGFRNSFYGRMAGERLAEVAGEDAFRRPELDRALILDRFRIRRGEGVRRVEDLYAAGLAGDATSAANALARAGEPDDGAFHSIKGWLEGRRRRNVPAIQAMQRAAPFHTSIAGDELPAAFWRVFYPLDYESGIRTGAERWDLDPHLVAALIRQESAFSASTRSPVGARGLMQIMPPTGRALARVEGVRFSTGRLYEPSLNIRLGTRYLRQLLDEFGARADYALAGYNAGPHRVRNWSDGDLGIPLEVWVEEIPFTETRNYVKLIMRNEMMYERLYPELDRPADP